MGPDALSEGLRTVAVAFFGLGAGFAWYAVRSSMVPATSPDRLVAELRLAQFAALLLVLTAGAYIGFAVANETVVGVGLDIAFAVGFLVVAASTLVRDPRQALTILAWGKAPTKSVLISLLTPPIFVM